MGEFAKIALGGGCHWCTEAVFCSLKGVYKVEQGFVASDGEHSTWSEAIIIHYMPDQISLRNLIEVHLHTHKSTVAHSMRNKYRSAVYFFNLEDRRKIDAILTDLQEGFDEKLVTKVLPFSSFKPSEEQFHDYYYSNPQRPFCETYISPKLRLLLAVFSDIVNSEKLKP